MRLLPLILATLVASCLAPTVSEAQTANNFTVTSFSASPTPVQPGGVLQLAATVTSSQAVGNYTVGFVAYVNNQAVWSQFFPNLDSTTGGSVTETYNLPIPTSASPGSYQFVVGVWSPNWVWYTGALTTVTVGSAPPSGTGSGSANWYTNGYPTPQYTCNSNYYVSPTGSDSNSGTLANPWLTVSNAWARAAGPGVCVNVEAGSYAGTTNPGVALSKGGNSNSPTGYAVLRSVNSSGTYSPAVDSFQGIHAGSAARIYSNGPTPGGTVQDLIRLQAPYIIIDGLEIDGNNANNSQSCIAVNGGQNATWHHVIVENSLVHDCGGHGISMNGSEYFWVWNNAVHNNAALSMYEESGISFFEPLTASGFTPNAADNALRYHIIVAQNMIWDNFESWEIATSLHTDGNGIIFDGFSASGYTFPSLIYGNVSCFNGGAGINLVKGNHVTVANNSTYSNYLDLLNTGAGRAEGAEFSSPNYDNTWVNNIFQNVTSGSGIVQNNWSSGRTWTVDAGWALNIVSSGNIYSAASAAACTSGAIAPSGTGSNIADGTCHWNYVSAAGSLSKNITADITDSDSNTTAGDVVTKNIGYPGPSYNSNSHEPFCTGHGCPPMTVSNPLYTNPGTVPTSSTNTIPCNLRPQAGSPAINAAISEPYIPSSVTNMGAYGPGALP